MTIKDVAEQYFGGEIDIDVCDEEVDMMVAFCYDGATNDAYDKFLEILYNNVVVSRYDEKTPLLVCDFSGFYRIYREELVDWANKNIYREFDDDEVEYDIVLATEGLIAGGYSESQYASLNKIIGG